MTEAEWRVSDDPIHALRPICGTPCGTERRLRLYAHACCSRISRLLPALYHDALDVIERDADGRAGRREWATVCGSVVGHAQELAAALPPPGPWPDTDLSTTDLYAHHASQAVCAAFRAIDLNDPFPDWIVQLVTGVITATQLAPLWRYPEVPRNSPASADVFMRRELTNLVREIFGNPFRVPTCDPAWLSSDALVLVSQMYESRDFSAMPILADALQDAGCDNPDVLDHCQGPGPHVRGCWVVDLVLGK